MLKLLKRGKLGPDSQLAAEEESVEYGGNAQGEPGGEADDQLTEVHLRGGQCVWEKEKN